MVGLIMGWSKLKDRFYGFKISLGVEGSFWQRVRLWTRKMKDENQKKV